MSSSIGQTLKLSLFGESHGGAIGVVLDGLPSGFALDLEEIGREMGRRAPGQDNLSTTRKEADIPQIVSGFFHGRTTGTPLCALIANTDTRSGDYGNLKIAMRPGHADYTAQMRYGGFQDFRGGGHFSGRITAPLVFAGAVCKQMLEKRGIVIGAHIAAIHGVEDALFDPVNLNAGQLKELTYLPFPALDKAQGEKMRTEILAAKYEADSVGGVVECGIVGLPAGLGDPFFDSVESVLSHLLFSVPAVKGVEFGLGFGITRLRGSQSNDSYCYDGDTVKTRTNHNGGLLGGITSGMPIVFRAAVKPTSSIGKPQQTVNLETGQEETLVVKGRHDPCVVQRAVPVLEAAAAIGLCDLLLAAQGRRTF